MKRQAFARWEGGLRDGRGVITTDSGAVVKKEYSFSTRYESEIGFSPEELLAAALAPCFSMAVVGELDASGIKPDSIHANATVTCTQQPEGFAVTKISLDVHGRIPGVAPRDFERAVNNAKQRSAILMLLKDRNKILVSTHLSSL
jgi:osmotically inducible protein OsmC